MLVTRCYTRSASLAYLSGGKATDPNAFVDCLSEKDSGDSGPHQRWAVGILYDNIVCPNLGVFDHANGGSGLGRSQSRTLELHGSHCVPAPAHGAELGYRLYWQQTKSPLAQRERPHSPSRG